MRYIINSIPNILTLANLLAGIIGILFWQHNLLISASCIFIAMIFDFLDGFSARILNSTSEIGKQLDSLADLVSFGVLPFFIIFGIINPDFVWLTFNDIYLSNYLLALIPIFSALRLAKFNIDENQKYIFKGLPTPANALWIASIPFILNYCSEQAWAYTFFSQQNNLILLSTITAIFLISPIPLISLKFTSLNFKRNIYRYFLIIISLILYLMFSWVSFPLIILTYILISLIALIINSLFKK